MISQLTSGSPLVEGAWAGGIVVAFALAAWLLVFALGRIGRRIQRRSRTAFLPGLLRSISRPVFIFLIVEGFLLALRSLSYLEPWHSHVATAAVAVAIVFVTYILAVSVRPWMNWYMRKRRVRPSLMQLAQRVITAIIFAIGALVLLQYFGIAITPMLAGLGIGGLAIALALQPTLSNFFAGAQLVFDRTFHIGDYIELDSGERGFVKNVGWRSTRVHTLYNNLMIVPNSRLIQSIVTNYHGPDMKMAVMVVAGVSYSSDLAHVEKVALEVAREVIADLPEAATTDDAFFAFDEVGDWNINFWIWLYARDRVASFRVKSELIKRLHARFNREGIVINYPVRLISYDDSKDRRPLPPPDHSGVEGPDEGR